VRTGDNLLQGALVVAAVLGAPGIPQAREQSENSYWNDRRAVLLAVTWLYDDRFVAAEVIEDYARPALAESLLAAAASWPVPDWVRPPSGRSRGYTVCFAYVTDRTAASNPSAEHLPASTRALLTSGLFVEWMQELSRSDSLATWDDFIFTRVRSIPQHPSKSHPGLLRTPKMQERQRFGLLQTSPAGRWVLDPLQGFEIDSRGRLGNDIDTGFRIYDPATGNCVFHDVATDWSITLAGWQSHSCFVMAGEMPVDPALCDISVRAPVVCVGNPFSGKLTTFKGAPISPGKQRRLLDGWHRVFRKAYPKVTSEP